MLSDLSIAAGYLFWLIVGVLWGCRLGRWLRSRQVECRGRHAADDSRHAVPPPADHGSYAGPELTGSLRMALASLVSHIERETGPETAANGRHLADMIRLDRLATDLGAAGVVLHVISFVQCAQRALDGTDPAEADAVIGDAISAAVYDLTSAYRRQTT